MRDWISAHVQPRRVRLIARRRAPPSTETFLADHRLGPGRPPHSAGRTVHDRPDQLRVRVRENERRTGVMEAAYAASMNALRLRPGIGRRLLRVAWPRLLPEASARLPTARGR